MAKSNVTLQHNNDGIGYVSLNDVNARLNLSKGNDKIGNMLNISFPIHYTCDHLAECYLSKACYGMNGCFCFTNNQIKYSENLKFFLENDVETIVNAMKAIITANKKESDFFRWFAIGDICGNKVIDVMNSLAIELPETCFYAYTKKYNLVNSWIDKNGMFPSNLNVMFSLWTNESGNVTKVNNPYGLTETVFIPYGKEEMLGDINEVFVCPCSSPNWTGKCTDCSGCPYNTHKTIAFLEHSTARTKERDKAIKAGRIEAKKRK